MSSAQSQPTTSSWMQSEEPVQHTKKTAGKAMQLGKPKKQNELMKDL